mgnify:FL=1
MQTKKMAAQATFHCLLGCIIGELAGLEIGRLMGFETHLTILLAAVLSFVSGYGVSTIPLVRGGLSFVKALRLVLIADTLSILTMVIVDNAIMMIVPGAMNKDPFTLTYWTSRSVSFAVAFLAAWPVNYWQLRRGRGHALTHSYHEHVTDAQQDGHNHSHHHG